MALRRLQQYVKWKKFKDKEGFGELEMKKGIYEHYKGNRYQVVGIALHSETLEEMAVYKALYGEEKLWVRPVYMWDELVEKDGEKVPRFKFISE